jgi:methyl-accepting chemotaxis protein
MSPKTAYKRNIFLVDRGYQLQFVTRLFLVLLTIAVIAALAASALLWNSMFNPEAPSHEALITGLAAIAVTLLLELLIAIPLIFVLGVRQSHRLIGPVNRVKRALEAIGQGDFSQRVILRQGDALEDLARAINKMAGNLQQRFPRER